MTTPQLRFREFRENWNSRKIGDILKIKNGRSQKSVEIPDGKYPILATGGEIGRTDDFLYDQPSVLIGRKGTIDKPQFMNSPFWTVDTLFYSEIFRENDPQFIYQIFQTINWQSYNSGTSIPSLTSTIIHNIDVKIPSLPEQQKIAKFLAAMDARIDAASRKLELLRDYKTAVSQKIFSHEIRFPGFSDEWISRKLGEIAKITTGKLDANAQIVDGKYPFFTTSVETYRINSYSFDGEAILIAGNGQLGMIKAYTGKFDAYQREYVVMDFREISRDYLAGFLRENPPKRISRMSYGSAMPYITLDVLSEMEILAPTLPEQQKIASFLSALDDKISQNSRNLSALREFKKALLQQLMV